MLSQHNQRTRQTYSLKRLTHRQVQRISTRTTHPNLVQNRRHVSNISQPTQRHHNFRHHRPPNHQSTTRILHRRQRRHLTVRSPHNINHRTQIINRPQRPRRFTTTPRLHIITSHGRRVTVNHKRRLMQRSIKVHNTTTLQRRATSRPIRNLIHGPTGLNIMRHRIRILTLPNTLNIPRHNRSTNSNMRPNRRIRSNSTSLLQSHTQHTIQLTNSTRRPHLNLSHNIMTNTTHIQTNLTVTNSQTMSRFQIHHQRVQPIRSMLQGPTGLRILSRRINTRHRAARRFNALHLHRISHSQTLIPIHHRMMNQLNHQHTINHHRPQQAPTANIITLTQLLSLSRLNTRINRRLHNPKSHRSPQRIRRNSANRQARRTPIPTIGSSTDTVEIHSLPVIPVGYEPVNGPPSTASDNDSGTNAPTVLTERIEST